VPDGRNIQVVENCQIEWDKDRGVLYVHDPNGGTALRICGLAREGDPKQGGSKHGDLSFGNGIDVTIRSEKHSVGGSTLNVHVARVQYPNL
jgi:hypothetical protein